MISTHRIRKLYNLQYENFGFTVGEINALEKRRNSNLPATLKNYYLALGKHKSINYSHNRLLMPEKEIDFSADRYLMIYEENQAVISWGIKEEDLTLSDPPVWGNAGTEENPDWYLETNSTGNFLLLMSVYNGALGGLKYNANYFGEVDASIVTSIQGTWRIVPDISYEKQKVYTDDFYEVVSLSFDNDMKCSAVFIGTANQDRFEKMLQTIQVDWSYTSYEDEESDVDYEDD